jgi:uncharacterized membrane protein
MDVRRLRPMSKSPSRTFAADFKQFFVRGLVILLPTVLTLWLLVMAYQFVDKAIAEPINRGIRTLLVEATPHSKLLKTHFEPAREAIDLERARREAEPLRSPPTDEEIIADLRRANVAAWWDGWSFGVMDLFGLVVAIIIVYFAGRLLGGYFGRRIYRRVESTIVSVPGVKQVYPYVKQIVDFLFGEDRQAGFERVVVVEYPRKGIWSIGLLTGQAMKTIADRAGDSVTVFIPSSPTPFTGYTITLSKNEVYDLPITIDEALRFIVSGGVLLPTQQITPGGAVHPVTLPRSPLLPVSAPGSPLTPGTSATPGGAAPPCHSHSLVRTIDHNPIKED